MLTNLINFFLAFSLGIELLLIWCLVRQKNKSFFSTAFIYVVLLFSIDTLSSVLTVNSPSVEVSLIAGKARFITECFIIAILYNYTRLFTFSSQPPKLTLKNTFTFIIAFVLSMGALFDFLIRDVQRFQGFYLPGFSPFYWAKILFFLGVFYLIFINIISKYRFARRQRETGTIKEILIIIFPLAFISLFALYILPFLKIFHPLIFLGYFIIAGLLLYSALRYYLFEPDEYVYNLIPQMIISGFVLFLFFIAFDIGKNTIGVLLSIPGFLLFTLIAHHITLNFTQLFKRFHLGQTENLDQMIEEFSSNVGKYIDTNQLWKFSAAFIQEIFNFQKIAIISFQYDVSPYQIDFNNNFNFDTLKKMLLEGNSPIIESLELDKKIIRKFDHPEDSLLYQKMDAANIYLGIPLLKQNEILGIIFLGGERKQIRIPQRHMQLLKVVCAQMAFALDNIHTIQKTLQAKKMAEIGMLASQLAHDFQSFISIVKLELKDNNRLGEHANYTEKLVQDLLNYARPQELKFNAININHLIDMSLDLVDLPQNIVIEKHYADNLPEINVDINQMRRVFTNLIENSNRAMKNTENKRLKITTRPLRPFSKVQRNPWIYIEILDEGSGIPRDFLDKIFEPFFTTCKNEGGSGMGLAIVKQIITRHHGFIDVTSRPGKGTVFNIRLPYRIV